MRNIETGGPAFPVTLMEGQTLGDGTANGMTMRDYAAIKAMAAMLSSPNCPIQVDNSELANISYEVADAMLEARK